MALVLNLISNTPTKSDQDGYNTHCSDLLSRFGSKYVIYLQTELKCISFAFLDRSHQINELREVLVHPRNASCNYDQS